MSTQLARGQRAVSGQPVSSTRQQLDELEALLQRMLDLPVQASEEEPVTELVNPEPVRREPPANRPATPPRRETYRTESPPPMASSTIPVEPGPRRPRAAQEELPADAGLGPRMVVPEESAEDESLGSGGPGIELPVPGGRHDLEADDPVDPTDDLARLQSELSTPPEEWVPFRSSWQPSEQTWKPLAESWQQSRNGPERPASSDGANETSEPRMPPNRPAPPPEARPRLRDLPRITMPAAPRATDTAAAPTDTRSGETLESPAKTRAAPTTNNPHVPVPALPLVWFNAAFDTFVTPLGPAGRWLKGKGGRSFLGFVGLLCLAGAAALAVADGIGWTW